MTPIAITTGSANIGYRLSDNTSIHAIFREFDSYAGTPGQVYYGLIDFLANDTARDSTVSVHLDDARGKRFVQHAMFGYHRLRDLYTDNTGEVDYDIAALIRTVPASPQPICVSGEVGSPSTTSAPSGRTLVQETASVFGGDNLSITERTDAAYQGTLTHSGGALVFGYQFDRQAGVVSGTNVNRDDNGFFVNDQYALTPRIYLSGGAAPPAEQHLRNRVRPPRRRHLPPAYGHLHPSERGARSHGAIPARELRAREFLRRQPVAQAGNHRQLRGWNLSRVAARAAYAPTWRFSAIPSAT